VWAACRTDNRVLKANNDVLERDGTALLSDYASNRVEIVRLDAS
jgi:hypothetical protein